MFIVGNSFFRLKNNRMRAERAFYCYCFVPLLQIIPLQAPRPSRCKTPVHPQTPASKIHPHASARRVLRLRRSLLPPRHSIRILLSAMLSLPYAPGTNHGAVSSGRAGEKLSFSLGISAFRPVKDCNTAQDASAR